MTTPHTSHNHYEANNAIVLQCTYLDRDGVPATPNNVECRVLLPDGTIDVVSATETGLMTGIFEAVYTTTIEGKYWYTFEADGPVSVERAFQVIDDRIPEEVS